MFINEVKFSNEKVKRANIYWGIVYSHLKGISKFFVEYFDFKNFFLKIEINIVSNSFFKCEYLIKVRKEYPKRTTGFFESLLISFIKL